MANSMMGQRWILSLKNGWKICKKQAKTVISLAVDGQVIGLIAIQDAPRPAQRSYQKLQRTGLKDCHVNGDNERVAQAIADLVEIDTVIADVLPQEKGQRHPKTARKQ